MPAPFPLTPAIFACLSRHMPLVGGEAVVPMLGGRTNRVGRIGDFVVKLYDPAAASPLFPNDPQAEALALRQLAPLGLAPDLIGAGADWVIYRHVPGRSWSRDPVAAAQLLGGVHHAGTPELCGLRHLQTDSAALFASARAIAGADMSRLPPLPADPGLGPLPEPRLIHGDAVAGNLILQGAKGRWIDWQCPALADPVEDIAAFLSPAMQQLYRGHPLNAEESMAFLAAYPDQATVARYAVLAAGLHWRIAAHCLWRSRRGDPGYAAALKAECAALPV